MKNDVAQIAREYLDIPKCYSDGFVLYLVKESSLKLNIMLSRVRRINNKSNIAIIVSNIAKRKNVVPIKETPHYREIEFKKKRYCHV